MENESKNKNNCFSSIIYFEALWYFYAVNIHKFEEPIVGTFVLLTGDIFKFLIYELLYKGR